MESFDFLGKDLVQLSRLALGGRLQDIQVFIRRCIKRYQHQMPALADELGVLLSEAPTRSSPLRQESAPIPVDVDSRLELLRCENIPALEVSPVFRDRVAASFQQLISERKHESRLNNRGLTPTKSVLFTGPPGVGKTLGARWLARELELPLLTLDLSAVMSSFLGRTGNNVRYVLDYAKSQRCVLFLDEFDAVAKRRDDATEIGELKRLVTVLLQEIDDWPADGLLLAATNHPDLLDPAVWRRFEMRIEFPMPSKQEVGEIVAKWLIPCDSKKQPLVNILSTLFEGKSFSEIERVIKVSQRTAAIADEPLERHLQLLIKNSIYALDKTARRKMAIDLAASGFVSQREIHELTGVSRDTIRKRTQQV